jgi:hypothetical protein
VARRPIESRLLDLMETDPRAAAIPPDAAFVWLRLGRLIAHFGGLNAFRFGPGLRSVAELAAWFRISVTELETTIETLVRMGALITLDGEGYAFPDWTGIASRKAITARENGQKHRPRAKAEVPEPPVPGQRRLPLVAAIPGGRGSVTHATSSSEEDLESRREEEVASTTSVTEAEALAQELGRMVGLSEAQTRRSVGHVEVWLRRGATADMVREVIGCVLQRRKLPTITGLSYFGPAIEDALLAKPKPAVVFVAKPEADPLGEAGRRAWSAELEAWRLGGCVGPMPPRLEHFIERARAAA